MAIPIEIVVTVGTAAVAIGAAAIYSYVSGNSASVDYDDDGNDEITFSGDTESGAYEGDQAIDPAYNEQIETEPSPYNNTPPEDGYSSDPEPDKNQDPNEVMQIEAPPISVREIGEDLESITGIGPTRAESFRAEGYETAEDLWLADNDALRRVDGIGPRAVEQIRSDIGGQYE